MPSAIESMEKFVDRGRSSGRRRKGGGLAAVLVASALGVGGYFAYRKLTGERPASDKEPSGVPPSPAGSGEALADPGGRYSPPENRSYWEIFPGAERTADREILASAITSEDESGSNEERRAIGWAVRNKALGFKTELSGFLSPGKSRTDQAQVSTTKKPNQVDRDLADAILESPQSYDPTRGSYMMFEPRVQLTRHRQNPARYKHTPNSLRQRWGDVYKVRHLATVGGWEFYGD